MTGVGGRDCSFTLEREFGQSGEKRVSLEMLVGVGLFEGWMSGPPDLLSRLAEPDVFPTTAFSLARDFCCRSGPIGVHINSSRVFL